MASRTQPEPSHEQVFLTLVQVSEGLQRAFAKLFKEYDLSLAQYNVLRILRGAGSEGATCSDVSDRLIRHDPDVTRLLDGLDRRGLVDRGRDDKDRRVVRTRITKAGQALLTKIDGPVEALHAVHWGHMSADRLTALKALLEDARAKTS